MAGYNLEGIEDLKPPSFQPSAPINFNYIASKESRLFLEAEEVSPGSKIILATQKEPSSADKQLWYFDYNNGSINLKADNTLCIEIKNGQLILNKFEYQNPMQLWEGFQQYIINRINKDLVIQTTGTTPGSTLTASLPQQLQSQCFEPVFLQSSSSPFTHPSGPPAVDPSDPHNPSKPSDPYQPPQPSNPSNPSDPYQKRLFFLVSELNGFVMDIRGCDLKEGAEVISYPKQGRQNNQLWYLDEKGLIHSALNDFVPCATGKASQLRMVRYKGGSSQEFRLDGKKILNGANESVDIRGASFWPGAQVITYPYKGQSNQHWRQEFV